MKGTLHEDVCIFMIKSSSNLFKMRKFLTKVVEKIKTQFIFVNIFPKIMLFITWKNMVEPNRPQMTI